MENRIPHCRLAFWRISIELLLRCLREILYTERPVRVGCDSCDAAFLRNHNDAFICADVTDALAVAVADLFDIDHLLSEKITGITSF